MDIADFIQIYLQRSCHGTAEQPSDRAIIPAFIPAGINNTATPITFVATGIKRGSLRPVSFY